MDFHIHDLRHTCAAWLISAGVALAEVRDLLGLIGQEAVYALFDALTAQDGTTGLMTLEQQLEKGKDARQLLLEFASYCRSLMLFRAAPKLDSPVLASFLGAATIGTLAVPMAHWKHSPPAVFSIAAVIPMVPGVFAYRTMIGLVQLTGEVGNAYQQALSETINNGVKAVFILMALAVGVALPNIVMRQDSAKQMKIGKRKTAP